MKILLSILILFSFKFIHAQEGATNEKSNGFLLVKAGFIHDETQWTDHYINGFQPGYGFNKSDRHLHSLGFNNLQLTLGDDLYFIKNRFSIGFWYQYKFYFTKSKLNPYSSLLFNLLYKHEIHTYVFYHVFNLLEFRTIFLLGLNYKITPRLNLFAEAGLNVLHLQDILEFNKEERFLPYAESLTQQEVNLGISYNLK